MRTPFCRLWNGHLCAWEQTAVRVQPIWKGGCISHLGRIPVFPKVFPVFEDTGRTTPFCWNTFTTSSCGTSLWLSSRVLLPFSYTYTYAYICLYIYGEGARERQSVTNHHKPFKTTEISTQSFNASKRRLQKFIAICNAVSWARLREPWQSSQLNCCRSPTSTLTPPKASSASSSVSQAGASFTLIAH